jgi:hypothetical protein
MSSLAILERPAPAVATTHGAPSVARTQVSRTIASTLTIPLDVEPRLVREALGRLDLAGSVDQMFHALDCAERLALAPTYLPSDDASSASVGIIWRFGGDAREDGALPHAFASFDEPGHLKARWDVSVERCPAADTYLSIRTAFIPTDDDARRRLLEAWGIIEPLGCALARRFARAIRSAVDDREEEL